MTPIIMFVAAAGFVGGLVRGLVGVLKAVRSGRKLTVKYFATTRAFLGEVSSV